MKVRTGIMVNSSQVNTASSGHISLTGQMIQAVGIGQLKKSVQAEPLSISEVVFERRRRQPPHFIFAIAPTAVSIVPTTV
jgi:hypothetical protein